MSRGSAPTRTCGHRHARCFAEPVLSEAEGLDMTGGRVVVFGTSNFAVDQIFDAYGNGDMFVNSVDWSAEQEDLTNITPKTPTERTFNVPSQPVWWMILLSSVIIIPGLVVVAGVSAWLSRRRRG